MRKYIYLTSTPAGRILRVLIGSGMILTGILLDRHGSCIAVLLIPGMIVILLALLDLSLIAAIIGYSPIGEKARRRFRLYNPKENRVINLTYIEDLLRMKTALLLLSSSGQDIASRSRLTGEMERNS